MPKMIVVIDNITEGQAKAFEHLFAGMNRLGSWGCSRALLLGCDGDGDFRPKILIGDDGNTSTIREPQLDPERDFDTSQSTIRIGMNY